MIDKIIECARGAGEIALGYFRSGDRLRMENKLNDSDIVTTADRESEEYIKDFIKKNFSTHSILSEETGTTAGSDNEVRWVVDPIDGTTNFFAGIPLWAISIGVEVGGVTEYGVVYLPATGELFHARRGCGAFLNGQPIHVSAETCLSRSVISTGFPVDKDTNPDNNLDNFAAVLPHVRDMRRLGSAAADLCYTAAGILEGFWELGLHEWDVCAGALIVKEAGGSISRFRSDRGVCIVCGAPEIYNQLKKLIK